MVSSNFLKYAVTIGRVAKATDCKAQTIRYYEQIGLLPTPFRSDGNQRLYGKMDVNRIKFIRHARDLGFSLSAIRDLLSLSEMPEDSCEAADKIAAYQLVDIEHRIVRLQDLKLEMQRMITQCKGGRIADCRVIEVLSNHALCHADHLTGKMLAD